MESTAVIADVQGFADTRHIPIDRVGVRQLRHPVRVSDKSGGEQRTVACFNMYVSLPHHLKGAHMSRFVKLLNQQETEISVKSFRHMLSEMNHQLDAQSGRIEMCFPYFMEKAAPISGVRSLLDYEVTFIGELDGHDASMSMRVVVPVTSLCPCSKQISEYGAHSQRSHVTVTAKVNHFMWIEDLIRTVEGEASCEIYGLLQPVDEKHVTEQAYDHPKFVEDMVRDVAARLNEDDRVLTYTVEVENFESIHNHSAYAMVSADKSAPGAGA
jgi:GTP cyclohydrolase I